MPTTFPTSDQEKASELLAFSIGAQEYCIDIMAVREIRGWTPTTPLPEAPSYLRGVVNLRGKPLPILDLASRLGLSPSEPTAQHVVIVVEVDGRAAGLLVSAVCDILSARDLELHPTPDLASERVRNHLCGLLMVGERMIGLLRTDQVLPPGAVVDLEATLAA